MKKHPNSSEMENKGKSRTRIPALVVIVALLFSILTGESFGGAIRPSVNKYDEIKVGVILDMGSYTGKTIHSCITMAISDFYASHHQYETRVVLHTRDSRGNPIHAISAAIDLLENIKVEAIIGPERTMETKFLAALGDKVKVPILTFSSLFLSSSSTHPFLVQIKQDETSQFKGIAAILNSYKWRSVIIIYEDSDDGREVIPHLIMSLQEANVHIASRTPISPFFSNDQILTELHKLMTVKPTIYLVHMSPSLTSRLFLSAKRLGMMEKGYAWFVTDLTMNQFHSMDSEAIKSLQGMVGLKAYIPSSEKLRNITLRWRKELYDNDLSMEFRDLDVLGIWAYDTMCALAESFERVWAELFLLNADHNQSVNSYRGIRLLEEISRTRFPGLSGKLQISEGKLQYSETFAVVNIIGKGEREIGFWTPKDGLVKELQPSVLEKDLSSSIQTGLQDIIWPGGSALPPKGWLMLTGGSRKLRIAVLNNEGFRELISVRRDDLTNTMSITGFCADVFLAAMDSLDYQVPYEFVPYVGSMTEIISQVSLQNYDGVVGDITITGNRSLYVDFTVPFTDLGVGTITKRENKDMMWVFSKPLHRNLWLTSAAFFILMGFVVWAIEHPTNQEFQGSVAHQIGTILWFGFSTLVYAHREKLTSNLSRFVVIVWLFVVLILTSTYTATLSSRLTVQQIRLQSRGDFIGTQGYSFLGGVNASNLQFADTRLQLYSPEQYAEALSRGSKNGGVDAIIAEIPYIKIFLAKYGADYAMVASQSTTNGFAFAFHKGSPLVSDLSNAIIKLREEGKLETMEKTWYKSQSSYMPENAAATPNILNLDSFGGLFLISSLSCVLAIFIHFFPLVIKKFEVKNMIFKLLDGGILAFIPRYLPLKKGNDIELVNV